MSPTLANFLFEAANFLLLATGLGWILFKPVRRALAAEVERHAEAEAAAKRMLDEADAFLQHTRAATEAAAGEIEAARRDALEAARKQAAELLADARRAQADEAAARGQEVQIRQAAEAAALAHTVGGVAGASVQRLLEALHGPSLDLALVRGACIELETLPIAARRSASVESARPLATEARALLEHALGNGFAERIVAELGAGVRVTTTAGQVDASAAGLARTAARIVSSAATDVEEAPRRAHG